MPHKDPEAAKAYRKAYNKSRPWSKEKKHAQKYRAKARDKIRKWSRTSYWRNRDQQLAHKRTKHAEKLLALAGRPKSNHCEICFKPCDSVWDHCHKTGKFRGWLCQHCNRTVGFVENNFELINKMQIYIVYHRE